VTATLGILGLLVFAAVVIGIAAGVTALVVKISPSPDAKRERDAEATEA
jgi:hypothetical protein